MESPYPTKSKVLRFEINHKNKKIIQPSPSRLPTGQAFPTLQPASAPWENQK